MSTYENVLPQVFGTSIDCETREEASAIIEWLLEAGTSFALTQDRPYRLWLSAASLEVIRARTGL